MNTKSILFLMLAAVILMASCAKEKDIKPSTHITTASKSISAYNQIHISDLFKVYVSFSETEEDITVEANANLHAYINVEKHNNELRVFLDDNINFKERDVVLNVFISTKEISSFYGAGVVSIELQNTLVGNQLLVELTGASSFKGTIDVDQLSSRLRGGSNISLQGQSNSFNLDAEGACNMEGYEFETNSFTSDLEGACNAYLTVHQSLDVQATGASNIFYKGNANIEHLNLEGGSKLHKMD